MTAYTMKSKAQGRAELETDIDFLTTPKARPSVFETDEDCGVPLTHVSIDDTAHNYQLDLTDYL